ncbi:MAG: phosphoribosylformylglycinamidine cyclo-ligase [Candidatus Coatesbacteria bacterium]|nr:MAG: phosphoribosylformylglycinamidine cyclo-ligase [Candidatus Coatesbacteria bacterium]
MATYKEAGVDQPGADEFVGRIKKQTHVLDRSGVIGDLGLFSGLLDLSGLGYEEPVLAAATDGVGSKLEIAFALDQHHTVGIDLVAMSVNDVICCGARPLFFLDYMAVGRLDLDQGEALIGGIVEGCKQAGCALLGGETSQLPTFYRPGRYDLAGFAVGIVERSLLIDGTRIQPGDAVLGLPSSGVHSNGFTLIRKIIEEEGLELSEAFGGGRTLGEELLTPTRIYVPQLEALAKADVDLRAIAHITGGGLAGNLGRVLPEGVGARLEKGSWTVPPIFERLAAWGELSEAEMYDVFNMGLGMLVVVPAAEAERAREAAGEGAVVGECNEAAGVVLS